MCTITLHFFQICKCYSLANWYCTLYNIIETSIVRLNDCIFRLDMSEQASVASGVKRCESQSPKSILFYYKSEKKCKHPEESESAEMTEETAEFDGNVDSRNVRHSDSIVCYSSDSCSYESDLDQSEESLYHIHSVTSCSTAEPESSMSISDTFARGWETPDNCIEEPMSTTQHAHEDDHRTLFHVDSSHSSDSTTHSCAPIISSATKSDGIAVSDIASSISQPPVQQYVKFPVTIINGKRRSFNSNWYKKYPWIEHSVKKRCCFLLCLLLFSIH